jgi:lysylphosphatidylglycerol synthetase-like protein (DUF2156 family)
MLRLTGIEREFMETRYGALRTISTIYNIIGYIVLILSVIAAVLTFLGSGSVTSIYGASRGFALIPAIVSAVITLLGGGLTALGLFGISQLITLLIDLEENVRYIARSDNMLTQSSQETNRLLRELGSMLIRQSRQE